MQLFSGHLSEMNDHFSFLLMMIWPYVESYWVCSIALFALAKDSSTSANTSNTNTNTTASDVAINDNHTDAIARVYVPEKAFKNKLQSLALTLFRLGHLQYYESVNKDTLKNALAMFKEMGVIELKNMHASPPPSSSTATTTTPAVTATTTNNEGKGQTEEAQSAAHTKSKHSPAGKPISHIGLTPAYQSTHALTELVERIAIYRRTGLFRKDGLNVSKSVIRLAKL